MSEDTQQESAQPTKPSEFESKILNVLQSLTMSVNELRQKSEHTQVILSSVMRTIADGRPLTAENLRESHHLITSEKVNKVFNNAVDIGVIKTVDTVEEDSIVMVQEFNAEGVELHRASEFSMSSIDEEFKALFRGKTLGDKVALFKDGKLVNSFVVQGIFKPLEKVEKDFVKAPTEEVKAETV